MRAICGLQLKYARLRLSVLQTAGSHAVTAWNHHPKLYRHSGARSGM